MKDEDYWNVANHKERLLLRVNAVCSDALGLLIVALAVLPFHQESRQTYIEPHSNIFSVHWAE